MKRVVFAAVGLLSLSAHPAFARGVSPYLPQNLDPGIERDIERLLILADRPVMTRPIAAATVLDALPKACESDRLLCQRVRRYLARYMRTWGMTEASLEGATSSGSDRTIPNRYGLSTSSNWNASAQGFWQPNDHALLALGGVAYDGEVVPQGSLVSMGWDRAQLDLGYRARWLSPFADSSMLSSTEAATMPSVTLSNYAPITRWGFHYEAFGALMSESDSIAFAGALNRGRPRLAGVHMSIEPAEGWSLGVNRILQYGGGPRASGVKDLLKAFFNPRKYDNTSQTLTSDQQFGNQLASVTSQFIFPGKTPFTVYFEYAGEDTSNGKNWLLGNASLSAGIHFPQLWQRFDFTFEMSEWQNGWYVNSVYGDGLTNKGHVIGNWGGDERVRGDGVGARTSTAKLDWDATFGGVVEFQYRTIANQSYGAVPYRRGYDATLSYSRPLGELEVGAEAFVGRNVFGDNFSRAGVFVRYAGDTSPMSSSFDPDPVASDPTAQIFVDAGVNANRVRIDLDGISADASRTSLDVAPHFAVGARRAVSDRSDLGARLELDDINGHILMSVRAIDYRYRFANPLALSVFVGAARYSLATPAYGMYFGTGLQWRDVRPGWDVGMDVSKAIKVARDHLLPSDPTSAQPDSFYDIGRATLSVTRRF